MKQYVWREYLEQANSMWEIIWIIIWTRDWVKHTSSPLPLSLAEQGKGPGGEIKEGWWKDLEENDMSGGAVLPPQWELRSQV